MSYTDFEDEGPCVHHRSHFDTIPAPPPTPDNAHILKEPVFILSRYGRERLAEVVAGPFHLAGPRHSFDAARVELDARYGMEKGIASAPRNPSDPTMLSFVGGEVELPKPTRAELVLSAQQWATRAHEELFEFSRSGGDSHILAASSALVRLDAVLSELADATR